MLKLGYKVVRRLKKDKNSLFRSMTTEKERETFYLLGTWALPLLNCGPLTVFSSRKAARFCAKNISFGGSRFDYIVKRCLYESSERTEVFYFDFYTRGVKKETVRSLEVGNAGLILPGTTRLAEKVMIF